MQAHPKTRLDRLARILEPGGHDDPLARVVDLSLMALIVLNVVAIVMESVPSIGARHRELFQAFEVFSVAVFTVEFMLRVVCARHVRNAQGQLRYRHTWQFLRSPLAIIDVLAILPFYVSMLFAVDLRFMLALRLLRLFKLTRYSSAMTTLMLVLREEASAILAALFVLLIVLILTSCGIFLLEHDIQPEAFGSIPAAMWWAMATLTTVGYGDVTPITPLGKLFGGFVTVIGMGMVALPAGILASGFSSHMHRSEKIYDDALRSALADGHISEHEREKLRHLQEALGIDRDAAEALLVAARQKPEQLSLQFPVKCPHCGAQLRE